MKYKFSNWLIENKDWNWKPQEWDPTPQATEPTPQEIKANIAKSPTTYFSSKKPAAEWVQVLYTNMKKLIKNLSKDEINTVMYRFNQIIKQIENKNDKELSKNEILNIANSADIGYDTTNILKQLFNMI